MAIIKFVVKEDIDFINVDKNLANSTHKRSRTFLGIPIYNYEFTRTNTVQPTEDVPKVGFKKK